MLVKNIGFEFGVLEAGLTGVNTSFNTGIKRTGVYSLKILPQGNDFLSWLKIPLDSPLSEFYYQFPGYYTGTILSTRKIFKWCKGSTVLGGIKLDSATGKLQLWTGNFDTLVATGNTVLLPNTSYVIEVYIKIADSGGVLTLRVDMVEDATFSGDTKPGTDADVDNLIHGNSDGATFYLDDLVLNDTTGTLNNSWPGGAKVILLPSVSDDTPNDMTPTPSGDHFACIDEVPPSGTDNLQAGSVALEEKFGLGDLPEEAQQILAVIPTAWAFKAGSTSPTKLALGIDIGGGADYSPDLELPTDQGQVLNIWEEKPGGGAFSVAEVNALKLLLKAAA